MPLVENFVHDTWGEAENLIVSELHTFNLEYSVMSSDEKPYLVNLLAKSCTCRFFDIEKYPCIHGKLKKKMFIERNDISIFLLEILGKRRVKCLVKEREVGCFRVLLI